VLFSRMLSFVSLTAVALSVGDVNAASIVGIDHSGNIHLISTETGSFSTLGSLGLPRTHGLSRAPSGDLFTISSDDEGADTVRRIDEGDYSSVTVASSPGLTYGLGGIAFTSDVHAFITTRAYEDYSPLVGEADLGAGTASGIAFLEGFLDDILTIAMRDDGMLVGISSDFSTDTNALVEINPVTARVTVIAQLVGVHAEAFSALTQTADGAFFVNSSVQGDVSEIWSIDLYTGSHQLESTISGLPGITGLAPIPEPTGATLIFLGLSFLASRRRSRKLIVIGLICVPLCLHSLQGSASELDEIVDLLDAACKEGALGESDCTLLRACIEDTGQCSEGSLEALSSFSESGGLEEEEGGASAAMAPITGASIQFRVDNSANPMLSPSGDRIAFEETNGPVRVHRAVFGDGIPGGSEAPAPDAFGSRSNLIAGIDDSGFVAGTRSQTSPTLSQAYVADSSVGTYLTLTDNFSNTFTFAGAFDVDANSVRIVGSVFDSTAGTFGKNYPAFWQFNSGSGLYELRRWNGLSASTSWTQAAFRAVTPAGTHGVGYSGGTGAPTPNGRRAFINTLGSNTFTALPFIPSATTNFSEANALSDSRDTVVGRATNSTGSNIATAWLNVGGSWSVNELPLFGTATSSAALAVSGDGLSIGGTVGPEAAVWDGVTLAAHRLSDIVQGIGLVIPPECVLSSVTAFDFAGFRVVGDATCDTGSGPFKRVYELEVPFAVPEPGIGLSLGLAIPFMMRLRRSAASQYVRRSHAGLNG